MDYNRIRLPCTCYCCQRIVSKKNILIKTCVELRCVCGVFVTLEMKEDAGVWDVRYRCASRRCGFNIEAENPYFRGYTKMLSDSERYLSALDDDNVCECGKIARIDVETLELNGEEQLQFLYVCDAGICKRKFSLLDYAALTREGVRCPCFKPCKLNTLTEVYECPEGVHGCGYACHRMDSVTFAQIEEVVEELREHALIGFRKKAKDVCSEPGILKFQYNTLYTKGKLVYRCKDKMCKETKYFF